MNISSVIIGTGSYLPEKILSNADLEKMVDTSHDWIVQRSGIKERRIAGENETTGDMAIGAAKKAIEASGLSVTDLDGVIVATTTPDRTFPAVAVKVQAELGMAPGLAFDVQAVCTGFIYALATADNFIRQGQAKRILVIGAEKMSSIIDWEDRGTCVLFADGAGAVVLEASQNNEGIQGRGIHSTHLHANGAQRNLLFTDGGVSMDGRAGHIVMQGREVFKYAVSYMAEVVQEVLAHNQIKTDEIDWLVPHQANIRIIDAMQKKMGMASDRVVRTVEQHANTSAASIPLALAVAVDDGRIKNGDVVAMEAIGGGLVWGAALVKFGKPY